MNEKSESSRRSSSTPPSPQICPCGKEMELRQDFTTSGKWGEGPTVEFRDEVWACPACGEETYTFEQANRHTLNLLKATVEHYRRDNAALNTLVSSLIAIKHIETLPKNTTIRIDQKPFIVAGQQTESMLKALVGKDVGYRLFLEAGAGPNVDRLISQSELVTVIDGMTLFTVPHASF